MNSVLSPPRSFHFFGNLIFSLLLFNLLSTQVARCETKPLTGVTLRGPNNTTSFTLDTNAPGQTSSATLTASAHTPDGETTMRIPNMNFASGFRFEWVAPSNVVQYKKVGGQWTQMTANDPARGTVSVAPQRVGCSTASRLHRD